jgi:hypothetical protein
MAGDAMKRENRYAQIIEELFFSHYKEGDTEVDFDRSEIQPIADRLNIKLPLNLGDVIYSFRYRASLPESITAKAPEGTVWIIRPVGKAKYRMIAIKETPIVPNTLLAETKVPDSTPGVVAMYSMNDEQALLAKVRYNRLIDIFTGITSYSLQNHLRTTVVGMGQVETEEIYIGIDRRGVHYVFPVQAKGGTDKLNIVQIEQDIALCNEKFKGLVCIAIAAQFMNDSLIALFGFQETPDGIGLTIEKHYRLTPPEDVTQADLQAYQLQPL